MRITTAVWGDLVHRMIREKRCAYGFFFCHNESGISESAFRPNVLNDYFVSKVIYQRTRAFARYLARNNRRVCCKGVYGFSTESILFAPKWDHFGNVNNLRLCSKHTHRVTSQWWTAIIVLILLSETNKFEFDYLQLMIAAPIWIEQIFIALPIDSYLLH